MLLSHSLLVPLANPLGLKAGSKSRWGMQPRCRQMGLTVRATIIKEQSNVQNLEGRKEYIAGEVYEAEGREQNDSNSPSRSEEEEKQQPHPLKGRKRSTEVVAKILETKAARQKRHSEETKEKMRQAHLNLKHTIVTRIKISKSRTGQKHSEETRQKMSIARKEYWDRKHQERKMLEDNIPREQEADAESKMANLQSQTEG